MQSNYDVKFYDFIKTEDDPACPYNTAGCIQVWDLLKALKHTDEQIYFRLRTDIWFTDTSLKVLLEYLDLIVQNKLDAAFFGLDFRKRYKDTKFESPFDNPIKRVFDWIFIGNKYSIDDHNVILDRLDRLQKKGFAHLCFYTICKPNIRALNVSTQMYLIRKNYDHTPSNFEVYSDFINEYLTERQKWVHNNEYIINQF